MRRAAIFGGSFDPVHLGHLELARAARDAADLERVILVPNRVSPFKEGTTASAEDRLAMVRLAAEAVGAGWVEVSRCEIDREGPSFSWETVAYFRERYPATRWHWILGADQWAQLESWAEAEKLREWLEFIVARRGGQEITTREGWMMREVVFDHPASSSAIRESFHSRADWLPDAVREFCEARGLYGNGK